MVSKGLAVGDADCRCQEEETELTLDSLVETFPSYRPMSKSLKVKPKTNCEYS